MNKIIPNLLFLFLATNCLAQGMKPKEEEQVRIDHESYNFEISKRAAIFEKALELNKPSICNFAGKLRSLCFSQFASQKKSFQICNLINYPPKLGESLEGIGSKKLLDGERDHCIRNLAVDLKKIRLCKRIVDVDTKLRCETEIKGDYGNKSLCDKFIDSELRGSCWINAAVRYKNYKFCDKEPTPECSTCKDSCVFNVAEATKDANLCNHINSNELKEICKRRVVEIPQEILLN